MNKFPDHEKAVGQLALDMGFTNVSLSSEVMPMVRIVPRGFTACADAYLTPCIKQYVNSFSSGFSDKENLKVLFMQSDGGLTPMDKFIGSRAILSGPAGGVVGYAITTYQQDTDRPVIGFDMGGTSTDVSRYDGQYEHVFESTTAGVAIQAPQLDINTVAAGGGSRLFFRTGMFVVGPESARANPGPTCYCKGGPLTITDANLCLGRLLPEYFPKIFGPNEDQPLDKESTVKEFDKLTAEVNHFLQQQNPFNSEMNRLQVAMGFIQVANETMCRPIRALTQAKGYDTSQHVLASFGGAGGQHACAIARSLGMSTIFVHRYSGILSAYGLALADVVHEAQEPCSKIYDVSSFHYIDKHIDLLIQECYTSLLSQGFTQEEVTVTPYLHMRYDKTDCALMCTADKDIHNTESCCKYGDFKTAFTKRYQREFGFTIPSREIVVDDIRVRGTGKACAHNPVIVTTPETDAPKATKVTKCYFDDGFYDTNVYFYDGLTYGHIMSGPAIIIDDNSTILIEPKCTATITAHGDVCIKVDYQSSPSIIGMELDTIQLSIFSHRFMSIAEQMGRVLQRTAISTNIKERLDFSCALFGPDGGLVANAPHIPVHLGAMQETVQYQLNHGPALQKGDVILSNHPAAGGSHLPDLTVITPVFYPGQEKPVFFVASRGHHADIGGITPGSMPPTSQYLWQEGMCVKSFKLVREGNFQEEGVTDLLMTPSKHPGCSGTRNLHDNLSDLRAQVAANQKGINLVSELIDAYGLNVVQAYMKHIQENAEVAVREMLKEIAMKVKKVTGSTSLVAEDKLDDQTPIKLKIIIDEEEGSAVFDFNGTGPEVKGNCNAPRAVTLSALIYCLRCMVGHNVPLNQGCLKPVTVMIPSRCILDPSDTAAVVGGNVLTCQRVVDVVFKAFEVCAASQGCMNNITFGDESVGYYETVAGGAGAGPTWHGRSGVHTHMTNTRITDPEILEKRYPVILKEFHLNYGSGGDGHFIGGDGVFREMCFRKAMTLSVLCERRLTQPYGLKGGHPGAAGKNILKRIDDSSLHDLGPKSSVQVFPGDCFQLYTPGGGGWGDPSTGRDSPPPAKRTCLSVERGSVATYQMMQESA
ncbi:5-oxoprolinase-like isoform X2 [Dysidea avara]|uniref:5-oxoprolinase-like isoform X2 n=1 Tax=Dysidea avara TaxID=196820 RepID=UPI00331D4D70